VSKVESTRDLQLSGHGIRDVAEGLHGAGAIVGNADLEFFLDGEKDGQGIEGVDPGVRELRIGREVLDGEVLFTSYDLDELLFHLGAGHEVIMIRTVSRSGSFAALLLAWTLLCIALFFGLRGAEDPSRRRGRILSEDAGRIAVEVLHARDAHRFQNHHVVHIAWARAGEGAPEQRWIVLTDRLPHTALREAIVIELAAEDGRLLRIRRPVS
jgi:hypothetical protein